MKSGPLISLDESFGHQLVAPRAVTVNQDRRWAERAYFLLHVDERLTINAGRQLYPHDGRWATFAAAATPEAQHSLRHGEQFLGGDDRDPIVVGPLRIEVVRPLEKIRLVLAARGFPLAYDLLFTARFPAVASDATRIEQDGQVVTDTMSFFQSGGFSGAIRLGESEWRVEDRAGFRDRSWGVRKHDGAPRRGIVFFCGCELAESSLYLLFHETASGRRTFTNGWLVDRTGVADTVTGAEHHLDFSGNLLQRGRVDLTMGSGRRRTLEFEVENRLYLSTVGYSPDPKASAPGSEMLDLTDPSVVAAVDGQNDHGARFRLDGQRGHGYVETGLGIHARYRAE